MAIEVEGPDGSVVEFPDGTSNDVIKGAMAKHFGSPTKTQAPTNEAPQDTSMTGALARGAENAATGLGALVNETGKHIGGGKTFPKWMAKVAQYLHDPNYRSGNEDAANPNADLGTRAAGVGRMLVEGAPGMAASVGAGLVAGPAGFLGTQALLNSGSAVQGVREADKVPEDQPLSPSQLARAGGAAAVDTALAGVGAGKALAPVGKLLGKEGVKAAAAETLAAAKAGALAGGGQRVSDSAFIEGKLPTMDELAASAAAGGAAGGIVRGARAIPEAGSAMALRSLAGIDPKFLTAAANEARQQSSRVGPIKEGNAGSILDEARKATASRRGVDAAAGMTKGPDIVQEAINTSGDPLLPYKYAEMIDDLKRGQPVNPEHITALEEALGGQHPNIDQWLEGIRKESVLNQVAQLGHREGGSVTGGLHSTVPGRTIDNLARRYGLGTIAGSLALDLAGHGMMGGWGAKIGAGAVGLSGAMRGIDKLTGYSNPVGRFVERFSDQSGPTLPPSSTPVPPTPKSPSELRAETRQAEMAARAKARAEAVAAKASAKKTKDATANIRKTMGELGGPETFIPRIGKVSGVDLGFEANRPEAPVYGGASMVDPKELAFNALLMKKTGVKDLNRINQFDNQNPLTDPSQVPMDDPKLAQIQHFIRKMQDARQERAYIEREMGTEKAMEALGIYPNRLPTPDAPTFTRGDMTGAFPEPSLLRPEMPPVATAEPQSPSLSLIDQVTQGSAKRSAKRTPVEEAMAPRKVAAKSSVMEEVIREVNPDLFKVKTKEGDVIHATKDTHTSEEGRVTKTRLYADSRAQTWRATPRRLSSNAKPLFNRNMKDWMETMRGFNNEADAKNFFHTEILPRFGKADQETLVDHFDNYTPHVVQGGEKVKGRSFWKTWVHKTAEKASEARTRNQKMAAERMKRKAAAEDDDE